VLREHQLRAFDLRPKVLERFAKLGTVPTQSAKALACESDMVTTCLPTSAEVREVLFGRGRVAGARMGPNAGTIAIMVGAPAELFQSVISEDCTDKDWQTLVRLFERNTGIAIAPRS
jgi:3-hydroxyisobutyrate dehydrogenase-like beta-hydroxyacid dehydrogenase